MTLHMKCVHSIQCTWLVNCSIPNTTPNVTVEFNETTYNSTATFTCAKGLVPLDTYSTVCTSNREWEPDPATLECREPVSCGEPTLPSNACFIFNSMSENSSITILCIKDFILQDLASEKPVCTNGLWIPDPTTFKCIADENLQEGLQEGEVAALIVVLLVLIGFGTSGVIISLIILSHRRTKGLQLKAKDNDYVDAGPTLIGEYSELQPVHHMEERNGHSSSTAEAKPPTATNALKSLTYAEVGPHVSIRSRPPPSLEGTRVQYASIWHNAVVEPLPSEMLHPADKTMNLDQLLIQLQEVEPHWMALGQAAGLEEQWLQKVQSQVSSGREAMIEVVDGWLAKLYPNKPTWREVADVVEQIGHLELSRSLRQVYVTGFLPIEVNNAVPSSPAMETVTAPPLPPRQPSKHSGTASPTIPHTQEQPPPLPPKLSRTTSAKTPTIDGN